MTAQIGEQLIHDGRAVSMCSQPLDDFFFFRGRYPEWGLKCSALWRGYIGTWEVVDERLYIVSLVGTLKNGTEATLESIFPGYPDRVFAHWYSGTLRIPEGRELKYVHMGYASTYERDRFLKVEKGVVVGSHVRQNGEADGDSGSEGHAVSAMTMFPRRSCEEADEK